MTTTMWINRVYPVCSFFKGVMASGGVLIVSVTVGVCARIPSGPPETGGHRGIKIPRPHSSPSVFHYKLQKIKLTIQIKPKFISVLP